MRHSSSDIDTAKEYEKRSDIVGCLNFLLLFVFDYFKQLLEFVSVQLFVLDQLRYHRKTVAEILLYKTACGSFSELGKWFNSIVVESPMVSGHMSYETFLFKNSDE